MNTAPPLESYRTPDRFSLLRSFSQRIGGVVILIGAIAILGWMLDIQILKSILPTQPTMKVNTALSLMLGGASLGLWHQELNIKQATLKKLAKFFRFNFAFLMVLISLLTWIEYSFKVNLGIDELLLHQPEPIGSAAVPGRMAPNTALAFLLLGLALLLLQSRRRNDKVAQGLAMGAWLVGFVGLLGHIYGSVYFYTIGSYTGMAIHTGIAVILLSSGILCARPNRGMMRFMTGDGAGSRMLQRLLPVAIFLPPLVGSLCALGQRWQFYNAEIEAALVNILDIVLFSGLVTWNAGALNRIDARRRQAEQALQQANRGLQASNTALQASQARFAGILEIASDAIISVDTNQRITLFNQGAEKIFGYKAEEILGQPFDLLLPSRFAAIHRQHVKGFGKAEGKARRMGERSEIFGCRKDGTEFPAEASISKLEINGEMIFTAFLQDITARKRSEAALSQMAAIVEFSEDAIISKTLDGTVLSWNRAAEKIFGYQAQEIVGCSISQLFPSGFEDEEAKILEKIRRGEAIEHYEAVRQRKDGTLIDVSLTFSPLKDASGKVIGGSKIARDISKRKQVEAELEEISTALKNAVSGISRLDPQGCYLSVNQAYASAAGYQPEEMLGMAWAQTVHPDDRERLRAAYQQMLQDGKVELEAKGIRKDGSTFYKQLVMISIYIEQQFSGHYCFMKDISDRKHAEEALRQSESTLRSFFNSGAMMMGIVELHNDDILHRSDNVTSAQFFGTTPEALQNQFATDLGVSRSHLDLWLHHYQKALQTQAPVRFEYSHKTPTGLKWLSASVCPIDSSSSEYPQLSYIVEDVTERKQAEAALQKSEECWKFALEGNGDGLWDWNAQTDEVFFSPRWKEMLGFTDDEIGSDLSEWDKRVHPEDKQRVYAELEKHFRGEASHYVSEHRVLCKDGTYKWILDRGLVMSRSEEGHPLRVIGIHTDISDRKRIEDNLRKYERIVAATTDAICLLDRNYHHQIVNQAYVNWHNLPLEQLIGHSPRDFLDAELFETQVIPRLEQCLAGETLQFHLWVDYPIAGRKFVSVTYAPYHEADQTISGVVVSLRNLTELKQAEIALQISQERLQLALEASGDGLWDWNLETGAIYYSPRYLEMLGYEAEELPMNYETWDYLTHPDDKAWVLDLLKAHLQDSSVQYGFDYRLRTKSGDWKWVADYGKVVTRDAQGKPLRMIGTHRDVSDRKSIEEALRSSEERYRAIVQDQTELICRFLPDSTILFVNEAYCRYFGLNLEDVINKSYQPIIFEEDLEQVMQLVNSLNPDNPTVLIENRVVVNGEVRWTQWINRIIVDEQGNIREYQSVGRDISDRKQAELELQTAKEAAEVANQSKSIFLANMSHELRTPLNVILGFTQIMNRDTSLSLEQQETIQTIHRSGEHLLNLINDILDLSKIEAGRTTLEESSFDVLELLENLQEMLYHNAESKGLQFHLTIAPNVPQYISADVGKLRQILINLLSNAIKFTQKGSVTLRVRAGEWERNLLFTPHPSPLTHSLIFEVEDTGVGIAADEIDIIFDAFAQSRAGKTTTGGTGLGLTISRHLVELMGGKISVCSTLNRGSTFQVQIPIQVAQAADITPTEPQRQAVGLVPGQPPYRILIVDDKAENRLILVKLMTQLGLEVQEADNGAEAIALWQQWQPHLIWMDIRMPLVDGYTATQQIRSLEAAHPTPQANTVIIALTAQASMGDRTLTLAAGCNDFVAKPFREHLLYDKMTEHLGVRFVYAQSLPPAPQPKQAALTPERLSVMPADWIAALHHAALLGDEEEIQALIQDIPPISAVLAHQLSRLAHDYQFTQIKQLAQENLNRNKS